MTMRSDGGRSMNRRGFLGGAAAMAAGMALLGRRALAAAALADDAGAPAGSSTPPDKPNSVIDGVHIGCITYSYRDARINTAEDTLKALLRDGLSEVELMDGPIRAYAGITGGGLGAGRGGRAGAQGQPAPGQPATPPPAQVTDAQRAEQRQAQLAKCRDLRKMYNDAGVNIHCHKLPFGPSNEDIDFNFEVAKALGCVAITTERNEDLARKLAPFAEKHKIWVAFHNHTNNVPVTDKPDPILELGKYIGFNLDVGHYFAGTKGQSPVPVIEKYHDRIVSLHLKDRTAEGRNLSWGKGQTPLKDVLQLLKKEKWPIYADIELEYPVPQGSDPVKEVAICLQYCRDALA
jgi:sugar phosphate isomerase/epimerase